MKNTSSKHLRSLLCVAASVLFAGCTTQQLSVRATEFNASFERANNEMLLLNVLRASVRRPMYFTSFSSLHGGAGFAPGTSTISLPFGAGAQGAVTSRTLSQTLGFTPSTFDMSTSDGQEFMRGITTPVDTKQIQYLWTEGWPPELLWMLFVQKLEISYGDPKLLRDPTKDLSLMVPQCDIAADQIAKQRTRAEFLNYPEDPVKTSAFKCMMRHLLGNGFGLAPVKVPSTSNVGPRIEASSARLRDLIKIATTDGLSLAKEQVKGVDYYRLQKSDVSYTWTAHSNCDVDAQKPAPVDKDCHDYYVREKCEDAELKDGDTHCRLQGIVVYLRSPEAIIYYLGELVRVAARAQKATADSGKRPATPDDDTTIPAHLKAKTCGKAGDGESSIFMLEVLSEIEDDAALKVRFDGQTYGMRRPTSADYYIQCKQENALHILSIVNQLVSLQRTAKEAPQTGVVRLIP